MEVLAVALAMVVGALVKAVTGMGLPPVAIPVLAQFVGIRDAVVIMALPTVVTNAMLTWRYRQAAAGTPHLPVLIGTGVLGAVAGAWLLTVLDERILVSVLVAAVVGYVLAWSRGQASSMPASVGRVVAAPVGLLAGAMQGATGMSGPIVVTFLHALRLPRRSYVFAITLLFQVFALGQIAGLIAVGGYTGERLRLSLLATVLVVIVLAVAARLADRVPRRLFDVLVIGVLLLSTLRLALDAFLR